MSSGRILKNMFLAACLAVSGGTIQAQERTEYPPEARARFDKGRDLQQKGQLDEAIRAYQQAIGLGMQAYPRAYLYQANSNLELKRFDNAIAGYTEFLEKFSIENSCRY